MKKTLIFIMLLLFTTGCASLNGGNSNKDFEHGQNYSPDGPTVGGVWPEHGFLEEEDQQPERAPASIDGATYEAKKPIRRAKRSDFVDESPSEGSLWASNGQTNYFFTKNKVRGVGDIISVAVEPTLLRDLGIEVKRTLTPPERDAELKLAQQRLRARTLGLESPDAPAASNAVGTAATPTVATAPASTARTPAATPQKEITEEDEERVPTATAADIDVLKSLEVKTGDTILGEIVQRYPNGNYKIRGTKRIPYRSGHKFLTLVGVAKYTDINEEDVVSSGKLYEYWLEVEN